MITLIYILILPGELPLPGLFTLYSDAEKIRADIQQIVGIYFSGY